MLYVIGERS